MKSSLLASVVLAVSGFARAAVHRRTASLSGESFLDAFTWATIQDPTHGRVDYVDRSTAEAQRLCSVSGNTVTLRADHQTVLSPFGPGRRSFRLQSNQQYSDHVAIFDIGHMPEGCGTWPAVCEVRFELRTETCANHSLCLIFVGYREVGDDWPNNGEIDIVEGINNWIPNQSTLHTSPNCVMPGSRAMTGTSVGNNCDAYASDNAGCGVRLADSNSFGPNFNRVGGGWYAVHRNSKHITVYFWDRGSSSVPSEVKYPGDTVNPSGWGTPAAYFPNTYCSLSHFGPMRIIINLTFCGDWAGSAYHLSGCPSTCIDHVNNNPGAFSDAYFEFNSLNIYA